MQSGEVEAGITSSPAEGLSLNFEPLLDDNLVLLVQEDAKRRSQWQRLPYIALTPDTSIRPLADAALRHLGMQPTPVWEVAHMSSVVALVREGLGFSLLPASCASVFNIERCTTVPIEQPARRSIGLLETRPVSRSPSLTAFMAFLREQLEARA